VQDFSGLNMVQIESGQPRSEICQNFGQGYQLVYPFGSFVILQPAGNQHLVSSVSGGGILLSQPGDRNFVSNSISVQQQAATQLLHNFHTTQQVLLPAQAYTSAVPLASNMSQQAAPCPARTIIGNFKQSPSTVVQSPSTVVQSPSMVVHSIPQAGPSPEPRSVPVELQTIQLLGDGQVVLVSAPQPVNQSAVYNDTNSTVNYLVQPADLKPSAPIVVGAARPHNGTGAHRKSHHQKKASFSEETISILKSWLFRNITHPYPTEVEKKELVCLTGLTLSQLNNWLINSRRRMLKRLLSTLEGDDANFNSKESKGSSGVNSRYANMWKNEGACGQAENVSASRDESEVRNEKHLSL